MEIDSKDFKDVVIDNPGIVLVDFYADWCGPCKQMLKNINLIEKQCELIKVNVDLRPDIAQTYNVTSIPAIILFKNGKVINQSVGYKTYEQLLSFINLD